MEGDPSGGQFCRGPLFFAKRANAAAGEWKARYYILRPLEGNFVACDITEKNTAGHPVALMQLYNAHVADVAAPEPFFAFEVKPAASNTKPWFLATKSVPDREAWKAAITSAISIAPAETETERHKQIDKLILQEKKALAKSPELKLLLLGPGHSGKSTILKQMKILHCNGFLPGELEFYKGLCRSNILDIMHQLLEAKRSMSLKLSADREADAQAFETYFSEVNANSNQEQGMYTSSEDHPDEIKTTTYSALSSINTTPRGRQDSISQPTLKSITIPANIVQGIQALWRDPIIHDLTVAQAPSYHLPDSTSYFMDDITRIMQDDFVPNSQDILRSRYRTSGVHETVFQADENAKFRIIDVGGQRGERKKWVSFFDDVTAVLFVAAISEYDQKLREDETTNRLHEALSVFETICKIKAFTNVPIILFLNKDDIFHEKIKKVPLTLCFPKYEGGNSYNAARTYITKKFERRKGNKDRMIYPHVICATDTESFRKVSQAVQDIILTNALRAAHL